MLSIQSTMLFVVLLMLLQHIYIVIRLQIATACDRTPDQLVVAIASAQRLGIRAIKSQRTECKRTHPGGAHGDRNAVGYGHWELP